MKLFRKKQKTMGERPTWPKQLDRKFEELHSDLDDDAKLFAENRSNWAAQDLIDFMPVDTIIRKVRPKAKGSHYVVQFQSTGTLYYGKTLQEALLKLVQHNSRVEQKVSEAATQYASNMVANIGVDFPQHTGFNLDTEKE